ncbi:MAG: cytochrome c [Pseudomonadota bacterium]
MTASRLFFLAVCFALLGTGAVWAHSGATGIVKERMDAMKAISKAMRSLDAMAKGKTAFRKATVKVASRTIKEHATTFDRLFPDTNHSRKSHVTEAAPAIWADKPVFLALAQKMADAAKGLDAVSAHTQLPQHLRALGATCKGCHEKFRIKKN